MKAACSNPKDDTPDSDDVEGVHTVKTSTRFPDTVTNRKARRARSLDARSTSDPTAILEASEKGAMNRHTNRITSARFNVMTGNTEKTRIGWGEIH
jgi:hypothetical protein